MPRAASAKQTPDLTLTELFNDASLKHIIANFKTYNFRPEVDSSATLLKLKKYQASANSPGSRTVPYIKAIHGHGRLFAQGGLSMQSMPREIRNAIAFQVYDDVDMDNAHPTLLLQFCKKHNLACDALSYYCNHRSLVLSELSPSKHVLSKGKQAVLAIINGGEASPDRRGVNSTAWLQRFAEEMQDIRRTALQTPEGSKYLALAQGTQSSADRARMPNLHGSAISLLLCDPENDALMAAYNFFEAKGRHVDVMVFDGCLVRKSLDKGPLSTDLLRRASDHVFAVTGYRITFSIKDMTADMLSVPHDIMHSFTINLREPRFASDDHAAGRLFLQDIKDIACSCMGRIFVKVNGAWTDAPQLTDKTLLELCLQANIMRISSSGDTGPMSGNVPTALRIVAAARALIEDDPDFEEKLWHSSIGTICFRNGLWDFRARKFCSYTERPNVYPTQIIPRDFPLIRPSSESINAVYNSLLLSTLGDADVVQTYLQIIARATAGEYTDKQWVIMVGERNCGKGMLQELNAATWGLGNVNTVLANAFLMQSHAAQDTAKALSWALDCRFARQTYTNEVRVDAGNRFIKLDGNAIKQFQSGGDVLMGRKNHQNERQFRIATKLIMNMNDVPDISPIDAISNMLMIKFPYKFVSEGEMTSDPEVFYRLRDDVIKDFCRSPEAIDAFTWLVIDAYVDGPVVPCTKILGDTVEFRSDEGDDLILLRKHFVVTGQRDDIVLMPQIKEFCMGHRLSYQKVKHRLERMNARPDKNCRVQGVSLGRGFRGVRYLAAAD